MTVADTFNISFSTPDDPQDVDPMFQTVPCEGSATLNDGTVIPPYQVKGKLYPWNGNTSPVPGIPQNPDSAGEDAILGELFIRGGKQMFRFGDDSFWLLRPANGSANPTTNPAWNTVAVWVYFPPVDMMSGDRVKLGTLDFRGKLPADEYSVPDALLTAAAASTASSAEPSSVETAGKTKWLHYKNLDPRVVGAGTKLLLPHGDVLRAKYIRVYAYGISWKYGAAEGTRIRHALGNYYPAAPGWKFPTSPRYSINVYQQIGGPQPVNSEVKEFSAEMSLNPLLPIFVQVNDVENFNNYQAHSGHFNLAVCVVA